MSETSTAKRFEQQQKNLIALLSKTTSRKSGGALPERGTSNLAKSLYIHKRMLLFAQERRRLQKLRQERVSL